MKTADFDYTLPPALIAQTPSRQRDASQLLSLDRVTGTVSHHQFRDLPSLLHPGDVLVMNDSRVIPARLRARKLTGARIELLLLEENTENDWWALLRPSKRLKIGMEIEICDHRRKSTGTTAIITGKSVEGHARIQFSKNIHPILEQIGEPPLPPYIRRPSGSRPADLARYQTVFAQSPGSVAAPTAGLHFTPALLNKLRRRGVIPCTLTLHVGLGTFSPVKASRIQDHRMHEERYTLSGPTAAILNKARRDHRRIIAVGTTSLRVLESLARSHATFGPATGRTRIFIYPPSEFHAVDALITNFHLPQSTLLMLISAFATPGQLHGRETILATYATAIRKKYRFFSYGDAMFIQ
ncbi:MAG: tRNA preQ1(34) S-adenosylmethionine ribosyltransferase-isomerase QueA [Verrucomicrobiales bacterium]|nr:tRNA preQ1(34) S-adenosylmethionine ribosyltransferase-isomerase QueA [Verrucomicrobiales bacterium]